MTVDRTRTKLIRKGQRATEEPSPLPPAELIGMVWELTAEAYSLANGFHPELPMQRLVVRLIRKKPG